jgi:hypothetical protein
MHPDPSEALGFEYFDSDRNKGLSTGTATRSPAASVFSPNKCLVHLDVPTKPLAAWPHHSASQLVQPTPRGLVTAQAKYTLKS